MSVLKNINYIRSINALPCAQPDPLLAITTAFSSAPPALLTLFQPGCNEIVKARLGLSPWHLRGMRGLIKSIQRPIEISSVKFLYKIGYFTAERVLYYWMVADVLTAFEATWTSQIYQAQGCMLPGAGTAYGYVAPYVYTPGTEGPLGIAPIKNIPGMAVLNDQIVIFPGYQASVAYEVTWDSWPVRGQGVNMSTWYEVEDDPLRQDYMQTRDPSKPQWNVTGGTFFHNKIATPEVTHYKFFRSNNGDTFAQAVAGSYNVSLMGQREGNLNWGCNLKPVSWPFPNPLA